MKKTLTIALAVGMLLGAASWTLSQGNSNCTIEVVVHGTIRFVDVETPSGCWQLQGDDGNNYELVSGNFPHRDGITGTLHGDLLDIGTICQVGLPTQVCLFQPDGARNVVGTLQFSALEGGCWFIASGNQAWLILNCGDFSDLCLEENIGKKVRAQVFTPEVFTICQFGTPIDVLTFEFL